MNEKIHINMTKLELSRSDDQQRPAQMVSSQLGVTTSKSVSISSTKQTRFLYFHISSKFNHLMLAMGRQHSSFHTNG